MFARRANRQDATAHLNRSIAPRRNVDARGQARLRGETLEDRRLLAFSAEQILIKLSNFVDAYSSSHNTKGDGYAIAILDGGFDDDSLAYGARVVYKHDFGDTLTSDVAPENPDPAPYHGTEIASIAAGNATGSFLGGVAPEADVVLLKVSDPSGAINNVAVEQALRWVVENADVYNIAAVNMSFGSKVTDIGGNQLLYQNGSANSDYTDELMQLAARDVIALGAAGNDGLFGLLSVAADEFTIPIGGVDTTGNVWSGSNRHDGILNTGILDRSRRSLMLPAVGLTSVDHVGVVQTSPSGTRLCLKTGLFVGAG